MSNQSFSQLRDDLYRRSPESRDRVEAEVTRLTEELGLAQLRASRSQTQTELAEAIGTTQSGISRLERQDDLLLSTLRDYVLATGGRLRVLAEYPDREVELSLPALAAARLTAQRRFRVVWQKPASRRLVHVGDLEASTANFRFEYTVDAELDDDFVPFAPFPKYKKTYTSPIMFEFFSERTTLTSDRNRAPTLSEALGLTGDKATPVELLSRSWGSSPHDTIQVIPEPIRLDDEHDELIFPVSGVRHSQPEDPDALSQFVASLRRGDKLELVEEPANPENPRAIRIERAGREVGYVPDHLLDDLYKRHSDVSDANVTVEKANGPETPWHLRIIARMVLKRRK